MNNKKNLLTAFLVAFTLLSFPVRSDTASIPQYLFSQNTASGSLIGRNNQHLKLTLNKVTPYITRFTDRPIHRASAVANVDFYNRWNSRFKKNSPNAVLSYKPLGSLQSVSIVLTISNPRYDDAKKTVSYDAVRIHQTIDKEAGATVAVKIPKIPNPKSFGAASLYIDNAGPSMSCPSTPVSEKNIEFFNEMNFAGEFLLVINNYAQNEYQVNLQCPNFRPPTLLVTLSTLGNPPIPPGAIAPSTTCSSTTPLNIGQLNSENPYCKMHPTIKNNYICNFQVIASDSTQTAITYSITEIDILMKTNPMPTNPNPATLIPNLNPATLPICK